MLSLHFSADGDTLPSAVGGSDYSKCMFLHMRLISGAVFYCLLNLILLNVKIAELNCTGIHTYIDFSHDSSFCITMLF